ncbi:hypothetical protein LJK88_02455 [Paenibacillus sp. P26]|nr:hypothetical protein LJK88_02455 [Paenibacillus sp. P26]
MANLFPVFRMRLLTQMVILISAVVFASMALSGAMFSIMLDDILKKYIGQQAMTVAKLAAMNERITRAFELPNPRPSSSRSPSKYAPSRVPAT